LYAGTENAVWVSFDDGDHWQSLQLNLPHTSMRDLWIHDNDLIVGTHGRSFWILDDISPLRELAKSAPNAAHLFAPASAYRIQRDNYTDTPLPPDEPFAANPPDGAIIDYYLPQAGSAPVTLEILDASGKVVRKFSSDDKPDVSEEALRKQLIPLYWLRPFRALSADAGMHRWVWDLHYPAPDSTGHEYPISAIPGDTPRYPLGPAALPGTYTARLTADGKTYTEHFAVKMDPRIKISAAALEKKFQTETRLASLLSETSKAVHEAGSIREPLEKVTKQATGATLDSVKDFQTKLASVVGSPAGFLAPPSAEVVLTAVNAHVAVLYGQVWQVDAEPTTAQFAAITKTEHDASHAMERWNQIKAALPALNHLLHDANLPGIQIESSPQTEDDSMDEE
jgi:hypothetical protein